LEDLGGITCRQFGISEGVANLRNRERYSYRLQFSGPASR
jgi:hypothetical protein